MKAAPRSGPFADADRRVQVKRLSQFFKTAAHALGTICLPI
jgi:hypothetical protein